MIDHNVMFCYTPPPMEKLEKLKFFNQLILMNVQFLFGATCSN